jgi:nucleoside 2-deoxyribosyltransferase
VKSSDVVFVWLDRTDSFGTLIETGAAFAAGKPLFVAFASDELATQVYFARQLATLAIVAPDAVTAWRAFKNWQSQ